MAEVYPGDQAVAALLMMLLAVCMVNVVALLVSAGRRRWPATRRYTLLLSAMLCSLFIPVSALAFWTTGVSVVLLPLPDVDKQRPEVEPARSTIFEDSSESQVAIVSQEPIRALGQNDQIVPAGGGGQSIVSVPNGTAAFRSGIVGVLAVWLMGGIMSLASTLQGSVRLMLVRRSSCVLPPESLRGIPAKIEHSLGIAKLPQVLSTSKIHAPIACGVFRKAVILPSGMISQITDRQLHDILTHEVAHLVRHDPLVLLLQRLGGILYWPLPFIHLVRRRLSHACEEICDNYVLAHRDAVRYGETLLRVAELACIPRGAAGGVGILVSRGQLEERIAGLIDEGRNTMTQVHRFTARLTFCLLLVASTLVCGITIVAAQSETARDAPRQVEMAPSQEGDATSGTSTQTFSSPPASQGSQSGVPDHAETTSSGTSLQRVVFTPLYGMKNKTNWSALVPVRSDQQERSERLIAHVTLQGEFPVKRPNDTKPLFVVKMMAGSDKSLNLKLIDPDGTSYNRVLYRDKGLPWKLKGQTYRILYVTTHVAADKPVDSHSAMMIVTCPSSDDRTVGEDQSRQPPGVSSDDSEDDGGSDLLRNIRASAAPVLAEMASQHGYGLAPSQAVRRAPTPFAPLRMVYYGIGNPTQAETVPAGPTSMLFRWTDGRLQNRGLYFGGAPAEGRDLTSVINSVTGIKAHEMEGDAELLEKRITGDWVVRSGKPIEQVLSELETILREELSIPVRLSLQEVERPVYVARGSYKLSPLAGQQAQGKLHLTDKTITTDNVHIFAKALVPDSGGGGTGDFGEFLKWLGRWIDTPIVDDVKQRPPRQISWHLHGRSHFTAQTRKEDRDPELVLRNITLQTNLEFIKEARPVKTLFVKRDG
jgi:beta-lactamase regulating signal transducer with metallopeptidase domain